MNKKRTNSEAIGASQEMALAVEQFLHDNYLFRRNVLSGKVEFATMPVDGTTDDATDAKPSYRVLTQQALKSIIFRAKREGICEKGNPKADITDYVQSEEVGVFNPIGDFLKNLPTWDGQNHIARIFSRLPGISSEQLHFLTIWLRSAVAHWLQMDMLHGNECVPTLIGDQGCGKTVFMKRLLPPDLREYFLDHLNLGNKFDKEMALTNNLLVNLDELDAIRPSQQASLKQTLSKSKVNGRPIYGAAQEDRPRYASFVSTTNNPHPLTDVTGSRRYICVLIPHGQLIDNTGEIDYLQLYAQVCYEVCELKAPYWFNNEEVARIQELNLEYMDDRDIAEIIEACFRKPNEGEVAKALNTSEIIKIMQHDYPSLKCDQKTKVALGIAMTDLGYEHTNPKNKSHYKAIPLKIA